MNFLRDTKAAVTSFATIFFVFLTIGGGAIITEHVYLLDQRDTLKSAANAASIATTLEMRDQLIADPEIADADLKAALQPVAEGYVQANLLHLSDERYRRAVQTLVLTITLDRDAQRVDVSVTADLGGFLFASALPFFSGVEQVDSITTIAKAESVKSPIEVVLAIDVSTSMADDLANNQPGTTAFAESRISIVKEAAQNLVTILNPSAGNRVAVGVVPWHIFVRLESATAASWVTSAWAKYPTSRHYAAIYSCKPAGNCSALAEDHPLPASPGEGWQGCLDEHRVNLAGLADLPAATDLLSLPSADPFAQAFFPTLEGVAYECLTQPLPANLRYQTCYADTPEESKGKSIYGGRAAQYNCSTRDPMDPDAMIPMPAILPLSTTKADIEAAIADLAPVGERTYSSLGLLWGQRLLSSKWNAVWGSGTHPVDPDAAGNTGTRKAIVLLTDGEDNPCGLKDPDCSTNDVGVVREDACDAAKDAGTEVFVIAAMDPAKVSADLGQALKDCSSADDNPEGTYTFLNNADKATLKAAFADIAYQLVKVRRTQ